MVITRLLIVCAFTMVRILEGQVRIYTLIASILVMLYFCMVE